MARKDSGLVAVVENGGGTGPQSDAMHFRRNLIVRQMVFATSYLVASVFFSGGAYAGVADGLASHRAVYEIELDKASESSGIESMFGRMVYEFNGSPCEGYTVGFRFVSQLSNGDRVRMTDQQTTTYENIRDRTFDFITKTYVNQKLDKEVRGKARLEGDTTIVDLTDPEPDALSLGLSEFPTAQMITLIEKAKMGEHFFQSRLFDGSDEGKDVMLTTNIVGSSRMMDTGESEAGIVGELGKQPAWPVSVAYFNETEQGDGTPEYRIAFKLYENGVTRDLVMDYGDFSLKGKLVGLEIFDSPECE